MAADFQPSNLDAKLVPHTRQFRDMNLREPAPLHGTTDLAHQIRLGRHLLRVLEPQARKGVPAARLVRRTRGRKEIGRQTPRAPTKNR